MTQIVLRDDQRALKSGIYNGWNSGNRNMLAILPTGGGKSIIVSDIALDADQQHAQQIVMAHRTELVGQMSLHVARRGIRHRLIAPKQVISQIINDHRREFNGYSFIHQSAHCAVGGVDTLIARKAELESWAKQVDRWTIDEAHHVLKANKWGAAVDMFPNAYGLGVTATPSRADGCGLGAHADGVFHDMVLGPSMRELIHMGALTDYEIVIPSSDFEIDENSVAPSGDFSTKRMREASKRSHIVGDVVAEYVKHAMFKRAICFATDVETSGEIAKKFNDAGIPAASVSAKTPSEVRAEYIRRFRDGSIRVLVNVDLFGEGFDVPACEVVIMARPTASLGVYLQQFGRALRTMLGKQYGLIIDHVSNWKRHGLPDKLHFWTMDRREKRGKQEKDPEDIELIKCRGCSKPYLRSKPACPHCGHVIELEPTAPRSIETVDGDLMLLDRSKLEEMRKAMQLPMPADVAQRTAHVAGVNAGKHAADKQIARIQMQRRLDDAICQWAGWQRHRGRMDSETYRRFYLTTGIDVWSALALPAADMEKIAVQVERWNEREAA